VKKALMVYGGWDGHEPQQCSEIMAAELRNEGFEVTLSDTLDSFLDEEKVKSYSVLIPVWTMGTVTKEQFENIEKAVSSGVGLAGWHGGMCDSFRSHVDYQWMTGGQFMAHPRGIRPYTVRITRPTDPIMQGISDFEMNSEQYYMLVDPNMDMLAETVFDLPEMPWLHKNRMPVVWKRMWGQGRVFYSSLGHNAADFASPIVRQIMTRGILWAAK
jgi:uncharacterized protein